MKFRLATDFFYYTLTKEYAKPKEGDESYLLRETTLFEPGRQKNFELSLSSILNETRDLKEPYLFVRSEYYIAPYSEATDSILTDYVHDKIGHQMIAFKVNSKTGEWEELTTNANSVCK